MDRAKSLPIYQEHRNILNATFQNSEDYEQNPTILEITEDSRRINM